MNRINGAQNQQNQQNQQNNRAITPPPRLAFRRDKSPDSVASHNGERALRE